jgi:very-short-patch-repair endonuclease
LWARVRGRSLGGFKFRRQHPIGPYVLDFYCAEANLAVEVDGQMHMEGERLQKDAVRTAWLSTRGIAVFRIAAEDVRTNLEGVLTSIRTKAEDRVRS